MRVWDALAGGDPEPAFHAIRGLISLGLMLVSLGLLVAAGWRGSLVIVAGAALVLAQSVQRLVGQRRGGVLGLLLIDTVVTAIAVVYAGLPGLFVIAPYGYFLTVAVLLLDRRRLGLMILGTTASIGAVLVFGAPIASDELDSVVVWTATAVTLVVYLAATTYLASIAAKAMQDAGRLSENLRASRARLHAIVESSSVIVFSLDTLGRVTFSESGTFPTLQGVDGDEVIGRSIYELVPDATDLHLAIQDVLVGAAPVRRDIRIGDAAYHVRLTPEFNAAGDVSGLFGIATDETQRIAASDALRRKVEMEQLISRLSTHLIGLPPEEIEDGVALALESVAEFVGADRAVVSLVDADGRLRRTQAYVGPGAVPIPLDVREQHGPELFPWLYSRLMSGRMLAFQNLDAIPRQAWRLADIWRRVGVNSGAVVPIFLFRQFAGAASIDSRRTDAFSDDDLVLLRFMAEMLVAVLYRRRVHNQLEELVRSKDQFIASVSHELRTPLTTVVGLAEELRSRPDDFDLEEQAEFHRLLAEQAAEVSDIVEDLLVVARADIGKVSIQASAIEVVPEVESVLRGFVDGQRVEIEADRDGSDVWADRTRLRQIVRNLLSNALRYGGPRVVVRLVDGGEVVAIEVADDGGTLTVAQAEELFEPYRHTAQVEGRPPSIGLGLTVGRSLARLMGGDLSFVEREGWTVFRLELPSGTSARAEGFGAERQSQSIPSGSATAAIRELNLDTEPATSIDAAAS